MSKNILTEILKTIVIYFNKNNAAMELSDDHKNQIDICEKWNLRRHELYQILLSLQHDNLIVDINPDTRHPKKYIPAQKGIDYLQPWYIKERTALIGIVGALMGTILGFILNFLSIF
jgi:hypothetical protein